ncbi:DinB family protein [Paenibacillus sp. TRM 82003]|nr:DinB family protein [Paenibacillus sp. TRM 82003]
MGTKRRPERQEYHEFYEGYVARVPEGDIRDILRSGLEETISRLESIPGEKIGYRYAERKWSIAEVIGHMTDTERVMSYRLLRIARGDRTPLPGFDQDVFAAGAPFDGMTLSALIEDFAAVRRATLTLLDCLPDEAFDRAGIASDCEVTVRALAYIIAGHALHHLAVLEERYV